MVKDFLFQRGKNTKSRKGIFWLIGIVIVLVLIVIFHFRPPTFLSRAAATLSEPVLFVEGRMLSSGENFFSLFYLKKSLIAENLDLKNKLADLQGVQDDLTLARSENETLRGALGEFAEGQKVSVLSVVEKPPRFPYDTFLVASGSAQGIAVGDLVYAGAHILIGTVTDVYSHSSKIQLLSSPGVVTTGIGPGGIPIELTGSGGGNFQAKVARGADILEGDIIYMVTKSSDVVGVVSSLSQAANDSFLLGTVRSPVNIFELTHVFVEKGTATLVKPLQ